MTRTVRRRAGPLGSVRQAFGGEAQASVARAVEEGIQGSESWKDQGPQSWLSGSTTSRMCHRLILGKFSSD